LDAVRTTIGARDRRNGFARHLTELVVQSPPVVRRGSVVDRRVHRIQIAVHRIRGRQIIRAAVHRRIVSHRVPDVHLFDGRVPGARVIGTGSRDGRS
jgi:hypothetical protein